MYPLAMAQYIGYLGPPPPLLMSKSPVVSQYFDSDGISPTPLPVFTFLMAGVLTLGNREVYRRGTDTKD